MSDAFNMPSLFQNNVFQNNWALRAFAKWCAVMRLLNRHSKETIDLQIAKLPSSAYYALASVLYTGAKLKRSKEKDLNGSKRMQKAQESDEHHKQHDSKQTDTLAWDIRLLGTAPATRQVRLLILDNTTIQAITTRQANTTIPGLRPAWPSPGYAPHGN